MEVADPSQADHNNILKFGSVDCSRTDPSRARVQILLFRFTIHVGSKTIDFHWQNCDDCKWQLKRWWGSLGKLTFPGHVQ